MTAPADLSVVEDEAARARFDDLIAQDSRIEPRDWMPDAYRKTLIRQISQHAHSEIIGMQPESNWISRAPSLKRKAILIAKVQDEAGHGLYLYSAAQTLGIGREEMTQQLIEGRPVLLDLQLHDPDLGRHGRHRLARRRRRDLQPGAAVPGLLRPVRPRDGAHLQGGVVPPAAGLRDPARAHAGHARAAADGAGLGRPLVLARAHDVRPARRPVAELGAVDGVEHQALLQRRAAPALRRHARAAGRGARRHPPDPNLKWNEAEQRYDMSEIDWTEFHEVLAGRGPANAERLRRRREAHEDGAWVREAAAEYARKQADKQKAVA